MPLQGQILKPNTRSEASYHDNGSYLTGTVITADAGHLVGKL
jgi:hypothetical protein